VIKHGKIYSIHSKMLKNLKPIQKYITKGIADSRENFVLEPLACDMRGSKRYDTGQCVIARGLKRVLHPEAVAVGRSNAVVVVEGLAIRFTIPKRSRDLVDEFDQRGKVKKAPIVLMAVTKSWRIGAGKHKARGSKIPKQTRSRKYGVRAAGGGMVVS
jgi:hypothetical protein